MVKEIPLQNGMVALVDDEDYERCSEFNWFVGATGDIKDGEASMSLQVARMRLKHEKIKSKTAKIILSHFVLGIESISKGDYVIFIDRRTSL